MKTAQDRALWSNIATRSGSCSVLASVLSGKACIAQRTWDTSMPMILGTLGVIGRPQGLRMPHGGRYASGNRLAW